MNPEKIIWPVVFLILGAVIAYVVLYPLLFKRKRSTKMEDLIDWNNQGMAVVTVRAVTATPINTHHIEAVGHVFPQQLQGFIASLSSSDMSKILLQMSTTTNQLADEKHKDVLRAVTIAAARYGFLIPIPLVCLDARTHALYVVLANQMDMCRVSMEMLTKTDVTEPQENYLRVLAVAGQVMMHYAAKGPYPSVANFIKTVNHNLRGAARLSDESTLAVTTAYAALTRMPLPHAYHRYGEVTDSVYYSSRVRKVIEDTKPRLIVVK